MSTHEKALAKLCQHPPCADLKWAELRKVLEHLGYVMMKGGGSRRKFYHAGTMALISCHQPHPTPNVDKGCIVDVVAHLKTYGFI